MLTNWKRENIECLETKGKKSCGKRSAERREIRIISVYPFQFAFQKLLFLKAHLQALGKGGREERSKKEKRQKIGRASGNPHHFGFPIPVCISKVTLFKSALTRFRKRRKGRKKQERKAAKDRQSVGKSASFRYPHSSLHFQAFK